MLLLAYLITVTVLFAVLALGWPDNNLLHISIKCILLAMAFLGMYLSLTIISS